MAVIVELALPDATPEQLYSAEEHAARRGQERGGPPYDGCIFVAATLAEEGARLLLAWRTEAEFRRVLDEALGPDLASGGLTVGDIRVSMAVSMAVPGAHLSGRAS